MQPLINTDDADLLALSQTVDLNKLLNEDNFKAYLPDHLRGNKVGPEDVRYMVKLMDELLHRMDYSGTAKLFLPNTPYSIENCPKHKLFFDAGRYYRQRAFLAGNRTGKTKAGAYETACHLTGEYPDWWEGKYFGHPVDWWAAGQTSQTTRDTVQLELMGEMASVGTGLIPADKIISTSSRQGVAHALDTVRVRHSSGGVSTVAFKSYDQDVKAFYGTAKHGIWLDEEPPELVLNECLIRTMTTNGILFITFTPLHGITNVIANFDKDADHLGDARPILSKS